MAPIRGLPRSFATDTLAASIVFALAVILTAALGFLGSPDSALIMMMALITGAFVGIVAFIFMYVVRRAAVPTDESTSEDAPASDGDEE